MANKKAKGIRAKTRDLFKKTGAKVSVNDFLQDFAVDSVVQIDIESSVHSGLPFRRYQGKCGVVEGKRGDAFEVRVNSGSGSNLLVVGAAHLIVVGEKK